MNLAIDVELTQNPDSDLLGIFTAADAGVEPLHSGKMIYLPTHFVGIFLDQYLRTVEAWTRLRGSILYRGQEVDCWLVIY